MDSKRPKSLPVSRLSRATGLGGLATSMLGSAALGAAGQLARGQRPETRGLLLSPANVQRLTRELARMRGAAMKLGQLLSMESANILPPELAQVLSSLRQDAHHMPPRQLKQVLTTAYGPDFQRNFKQFDPRPIASASIGQVHKATAKDGRKLALKIQYPGIRQSIDSDIANLGVLLRMPGLLPRGTDISPLLEEARTQLHEEADYHREAHLMRLFATLIEDDPAFTLPRPHDDLTTPDVLAMDFMESHPLESLDARDQATRDDAATRLFTLFLKELFDWECVQTDPNFANYRLAPDGRIVLLDFGATRQFPSGTIQGFRRLMRATASGGEDDLRAAMIDNGYARADLPPAQWAVLLDIAAMIRPALTESTPYDFGDTTLLDAMRVKGQHLGWDLGYAEIPPADALFIQRKLAGLVLLATRLRARVPLGDLARPYL